MVIITALERNIGKAPACALLPDLLKGILVTGKADICFGADPEILPEASLKLPFAEHIFFNK